MSKAEQSSITEAGSATAPLDDGYKRHFRYQKMGLVALLIIGLLSSITFWQVNSEKEVAVQNQQIQAETTINSDMCKVYPDTAICKMSESILTNPTEPVIPKDGKDGKDGEDGQPGLNGQPGKDGKGIKGWDQASGNLVVTYTDDTTEDLGRVVGRDGATGATGEPGRGIVSSQIANGALMVTYTDNTVENAGLVVGPKGDKGDTGASGADGTDGRDGIDGQNGAPGLTPTRVDSDIFGNVTISYSDGSTAQAGQIILPNIEIFQCVDNVMTLKLTNGPAHSAPAVCNPQTLPGNPLAP